MNDEWTDDSSMVCCTEREMFATVEDCVILKRVLERGGGHVSFYILEKKWEITCCLRISQSMHAHRSGPACWFRAGPEESRLRLVPARLLLVCLDWNMHENPSEEEESSVDRSRVAMHDSCIGLGLQTCCVPSASSWFLCGGG